MYNADIKNEFLDSVCKTDLSVDTCERIFDQIEPAEVKYQRDICFMNEVELAEAVELLGCVRTQSTNTRLSYLRAYGKWCLENVEGASNCLLSVRYEGESALRRNMVGNPLHLQIYLNSICEPESDNATDNIYRCYYWLAYAGVPEEDIIKITAENIDIKNMKVKYKGMEFSLYAEAIPAIKNCMYLDYFVYSHPNYNSKVSKPRVIGNQLVRGVRSKPTTTGFRVELSRRSKKNVDCGNTTLELSYYRVWLSGLYYKMCLNESKNIEVDFTNISIYGKYIRESVDKALEYANNTPSDSKKVRVLEREYRADYYKWKEFFIKC